MLGSSKLYLELDPDLSDLLGMGTLNNNKGEHLNTFGSKVGRSRERTYCELL